MNYSIVNTASAAVSFLRSEILQVEYEITLAFVAFRHYMSLPAIVIHRLHLEIAMRTAYHSVLQAFCVYLHLGNAKQVLVNILAGHSAAPPKMLAKPSNSSILCFSSSRSVFNRIVRAITDTCIKSAISSSLLLVSSSKLSSP